ncbi:MAG: AAA family ATPase [Luteitalea sp.]|nr:AAA family ATPase [Luteitalea sp.]
MPNDALTFGQFVDREHELQRLSELLREGRPRLALVYGRRRVGKTFLLTHAWPVERAFYFTAAATTPEQNRRQLMRDLARWSGQELRPEDYSTWRTVFRLLVEIRSPEPLAVVLDEFQYLGDDARALTEVTSELNAVWEERRAPRPLVFVLAGSIVRTLEALDAGGAPLHGRFAWKTELRPFEYLEAARLASFRALRDRAYAYAIFGGTPAFLAPIDPKRSLAANVSRLMLARDGEVRMLVETALLQEQGLRDIPKYTAILRAVAAGRTRLHDVAEATGLPFDTSLRDKIERLVALGYLRAGRNLGATLKVPFHYTLADPALRFYHRFVAPYEATLERNDPVSVWNTHIRPELDSHMGYDFERIVEQAYHRLRVKHQLPIVREWGRWEGRDRTRTPVEMDIACTLADGRVLTGAVKWNRRPVGVEVHERHLAAIERLAASGVRWAHAAKERAAPLIYVAAGGFTRGLVSAARNSRPTVALWTLEDLYRVGSTRTRRSGRQPTTR